ncbi:sialate O-acetylesterase [Emticicia sp.]|uniref:sialate O-acetylesterase n=1 Tax=Emticicia sp. TaxID=1930953 RepID=UPI0037505805
MNKIHNTINIKVLTYKSYYRSILLLLYFFTCLNSVAQIDIQYDSFPMSSQLFQRNDFDTAIVPIKGKIYTEGYTDISVLVKRDKKNYFWQKHKLSYQTADPKNSSFFFETEIKAELSEYSFSVYLFKGKDSTLIKEQNEVICGDIILVYGQSNALANDSVEIVRFKGENQFGRTAFVNFDKNDFVWLPTKKWNYWSAGLMGLEIQKQLIDKYKIPIGIINGAEGNKSIAELMLRDEKNHNNISTIYGRLLKKSEGLGLAKTVRAIVWRQGEAEAQDPTYKNDYPKKFDLFRKQLLEDYPSIKKIYTFQNNIYFGNQPNAGNLREFQRTVKNIYPDCEALATFGTITFESLHYKLEGYQQTGEEISRLIARDFLKSTDTSEIYSPNIKNIYFTQKKDSLILEFDKDQRMIFPANQSLPSNKFSEDLKDYIYLNGKSGSISNGSSAGNYIILKLKEPQNAQTVTYTPDFYPIEIFQNLPVISQIKNSRGLRAFTFKDFPVTNIDNIKINSLTGSWGNTASKGIELNWNVPKYTNYIYSLEKAIYSPIYFTEIGLVNGSKFNDYKVKKGVSYFYRLRIMGDGTSSAYSNIIEINPPVDYLTPFIVSADELMMFPNPVQRGNDLKIVSLFENPIKKIKLVNFSGSIVHEIIGNSTQNQYVINTANLNLGIYIIETILEDNTKLIKKFVVE